MSSTKEFDFFVYLIEQYGDHRGTSGGAVLREIDEAGLTDLVYGMYEQYHIERLQNAFDDLDELLARH